MTRGGRGSRAGIRPPVKVADGVYALEAGAGLLRSNVYFVRSESEWVLIDTASSGCEDSIHRTAAALFGDGTRPREILLTHIHPDHSGSAPSLARAWDCPVYVHPDELKFASADASTYFAAYDKYTAGSRSWRPPVLDRWILLPMMRLLPRKRRDSILEKQSLRDRARALDVEGPVPSLPEWQAIPTPGHTPGHVAFFRGSDRLLIAGDAVVTVELNSLRGLVLWTLGRTVEKFAAPPRYFTWSRRVAGESLRLLAELQPAIIAPGHGPVIAGADVADRLRILANEVR